MFQKKKLIMLPIVLILGLVLSGCGLFNDVDIDDPTEELSRADFLNSLLNDFADVVQSFIDGTEYDEGWEFPGEDDLDFSALFAHYDIFMYYGEVVEEEKLMEEMVYDFEEFVSDYLIYLADLDPTDFNDAEIHYNLNYKYFIEAPPEWVFYLEDVDYPQEQIKFLIAMAVQEITVDEEVFEKIVSTFVLIAPYEDAFKVIFFDYWGLLGWGGMF